MGNEFRIGIGAASVAAALALAACEKKATDGAPLPNIPSIVPGAVATAMPAASTVPAAMATSSGAASGGMAGAAGGNPSSGSPADGSTAVGGMAGGQSTGVTMGGKPAPTGGDVAAKAAEPAASR